MTVLQAIIIALFIYLAAIGSVVGNTLGWYNLGRPLVASFVVGLIMGNVPVAITLGLLLQLANLGSVTPGGAVGWDLSYATYIGVGGALAFYNGDITATIAMMWVFSTVGGAIGVAMWNMTYALDLVCNRVAMRGAEEGDPRKIAFANAGLGNLIGFVCRFIPALIILLTTAVAGSQSGINVADLIPNWIITTLGSFGGMMAALGMGILLSFLMKKSWHFCLFFIGFMMITYLGLNIMAVALFAIVTAVIYYTVLSNNEKSEEV
ncbi:MAG: PTS sugar transporter subunit IIC [Clostridiaceae bacterium]